MRLTKKNERLVSALEHRINDLNTLLRSTEKLAMAQNVLEIRMSEIKILIKLMRDNGVITPAEMEYLYMHTVRGTFTDEAWDIRMGRVQRG